MTSAVLDDQERARLEARYAEIATLAGGLAHEIRNPLSTIGMNLELMAEDLETAETPRERRLLNKVKLVQRECQHLEDILSAFLEFARAGELDLVEADLNELVEEFIRFYRPEADEHGIEISPHLEADLPAVRLDQSLIRQVLMNLALNAQHAMPDGGLLELQTYGRNGHVGLEFIDNGVGMNSHTRAKAFQAFFSTRKGGSGLGLSTVQKIVEAHNGTITCDSEPGRGTRFVLTLPAVE